MKETLGNIWNADVDCICITTNGTVKQDGSNIMGGGIAKEAVDRVPTIAREHGRLISLYGHRFQFLGYWRRPADSRLINLWAFPSKRTIDVNSDLETIEDSLTALVNVANAFPSLEWGLPRPGSNLGGLDWFRDVKQLVELYVSASPNITVFHYNQTGVPRDKTSIQA